MSDLDNYLQSMLSDLKMKSAEISTDNFKFKKILRDNKDYMMQKLLIVCDPVMAELNKIHQDLEE